MKFLLDLNESDLNFKGGETQEQGGKDTKVETVGLGLPYFSKLNKLLSKTEVWIRGDDNLPISKKEGDNTLYYAVDLLTKIKTWKQYNEDTHGITMDKLEKLDDGWGMSILDQNRQEEFMLYWYNRFHTAHKNVQTEYKRLITELYGGDLDDPEEVDSRDYFTKLSDCIGMIARSPNYVVGTEIPVIDTDFTILGEVPDVTSPVMDDKLDIETKVLLEEVSMKTNGLFRTNLSHMIETAASSRKCHGENLMSDYEHWLRMLSVQDMLTGIVADTIGRASKILEYIRNADNKQFVHSPMIPLVVENSMIQVDFLKNKIHSLTKIYPTNSDVLKAEDITSDLS